MKTLISVIIPVYNVERYIGHCIESIIEDAMCDTGQVEVIIVDDGSPDSSGIIADSYAKDFPFIKVIHKQNEGVAAARNAGIEAATGEWLYFVDSDDWLAKNALSVLCEKSTLHEDADILLFDAFQNTESKERAWDHFPEQHVWTDRDDICNLQRGILYYPMISLGREKTNVPLAAPWDKLFRREFVTENKLLFRKELQVLDDMIFSMEAFGAAEKIAYCKEKIYHYRYVADSITNHYKPDRVSQDKKVWEYIERYISEFDQNRWTENEISSLEQAYFCRIIKSFSICCRLCFFNSKNDKSLYQKMRYVVEVLQMEPYHKAFENVRLNHLEWKMKIMVIAGRMQSGGGIYILHWAENKLRELKYMT